MPTAYSAADAQTFVKSYSNLPIKGDALHSLQNYLDTHSPAWGVIVNPARGVDVLVWFDAANRLHVIENVNADVAVSIATPAYHTADESFLYNVAQRTAEVGGNVGDWLSKIPSAIPSPQTLIYLGLGVVFVMYILPMLPKRK